MAEITLDFEFSYADRLGRKATHRVRIFDVGSWTTVLVTDMADKCGCPSVTQSVEDLINALLVARPDIRRERMVFIEHYDDRSSRLGSRATSVRAKDESFDLVSFSTDYGARLCEPAWRSITKAQAEQWIGSKLP